MMDARGARRSPRSDSYLLALAASAVALALAAAARDLVGPHYLFILLTGVVLSAWFGGRGPGLLATAVSGAMAAIFFAGDLGAPSAAELVSLAAFVVAGTLTSVLYEAERRSRRRAEALSAERDAILRQMADGVILTDTEGRIVFANDIALALHPEIAAGDTVDSLLADGRIRSADGMPFPRDSFPLLRALREGEPVRDACWRVAREGRADRVVEGSAAPVRMADAPYGAVLLLRDVTESRSLAEDRDRLLVEREAAANRAAFFAEASAMLASSLDLEITLASIARLSVTHLADWCVVDLCEPEGTIRRITVTHADPAHAAQAAVLQANPPDPANRQSLVVGVVSEGEPVLLPQVTDEVLKLSARNDEHFQALMSMRLRSLLCVPLALRGRILGAITMALTGEGRRYGSDDLEVVMELAGRVAIAVENAQLYASALAGSKAKSDFLAIMSHELRTPLNAIIGYADLLRSGVPEPLPERLRPFVERTLSASRHLLQLINEVLTFSRIEAGRASIQLENTELSIALREVRMLLEPLAAEKQLRFTVSWPEEPVVMRSDPRKIRQILVNITANAIKFTERGEVAVTAWRDGDDVYFSVSDTGIGIDADHLERIFEPFWQVEQRTTRRLGGTGLGLSIVRRLAQLLDGDVHIQSAPGLGSTFTVRLPLRLERRKQREEGAKNTEGAGGRGEEHGAEA